MVDPGSFSKVIECYVKSSHQNDLGGFCELIGLLFYREPSHISKSVYERLLLFLFVIRTLLHSRTKADHTGKHFIQFSDEVRVFILLS